MNIYFERLKELWESMGYKDATKFAREIGYSRGENILRLNRKDNNEPGMMVLGDIMKRFPDFDFYFLLTGEKKEKKYQLLNEQLSTVKASVELYSCPDCRSMVIKIKEQEEEIKILKDEALELHRKLNSILIDNCKKESHDESGASSGEDTKRNKAG
jgi:hypothetical protein